MMLGIDFRVHFLTLSGRFYGSKLSKIDFEILEILILETSASSSVCREVFNNHHLLAMSSEKISRSNSEIGLNAVPRLAKSEQIWRNWRSST